MKVVHNAADYAPERLGSSITTIGNFDGVHRGHQTLIRTTVARARAVGRPACLLTFHPAPATVLRPDAAGPAIQTLDQKITALGKLDLDFTVIHPFDAELAALDWTAFADRLLRQHLAVDELFVGHDFRCGSGRHGTPERIRQRLGIPVTTIDAVHHAGRPVSSTRIRAALQSGDVTVATELMGRPHAVRGVVRQGRQVGRTLGFPTANLHETHGLLPARGVYATTTVLHDGSQYASVANIGPKPTFGEPQTTAEVHLLDFDGDLYGASLQVSFVRRLRDVVAFDTAEHLVAAIRSDVAAVRAAQAQ